MISKKLFLFSPIQENTYIVWNDKNNALLIDPGNYTATEEKILWDFIQERNLTLRHILLTHTHLDHVFGLCSAVEKTGLIPKMHKAEQPILDSLEEAALRWQMKMDIYKGAVDYIDPQSTIDFDGEKIQILFTPGHSPGSVSFYFPNDNIIFVGDALFKRSIGRTDLYLSDHSTLINAIKTQLFTLPEVTKVYPGHGMHTTIGEEKRHNPFMIA